MAIRRKVQDRTFKGIDLTENNVQGLFNECLAKETSISTLLSDLFPAGTGYLDIGPRHCFNFDKEIILQNKLNIQYLFGQLDSAHTPKEILIIDDFFKNYFGQNWTSNKSTVIQLLYLGNCSQIDVIFPFSARKNNTTRFAYSVKPTLSPKDPNFPAWWEEHKGEWEE